MTTLSEREKSDYLKMVLDIPPDDIDWLIGSLLYARAKQQRELTEIKIKICDSCNRVHPFYTISCRRCLRENLREFSVKHNHSEILDGIR